jgi:hypothetical protein
MIMPVIIGATGIVTKDLKKTSESIPGKHFSRCTIKDIHTRNITHNTESSAG